MSTPKRLLPKGYKLYSEKAEKVFSGTRFDIYQWKQKLFDGTTATFEVAKRNDTVVIIPVIGDQVVIVKERQPHWDKDALVAVGGMAEKNEELENAARRELAEETGLIFKNFYLVDIAYPTPGVEWGIYTFIAKDFIQAGEKRLDAGEKNEMVKISIKDFISHIRTGKFLYPILFAEKYLLRSEESMLLDIIKNPAKYVIK